jgi:hypothetical protein
MFQPKFLGALAVVRTIEPVQGGEVGAKQGVAPQQRSHCFFGIVTSDPHGARIAKDG